MADDFCEGACTAGYDPCVCGITCPECQSYEISIQLRDWWGADLATCEEHMGNKPKPWADAWADWSERIDAEMERTGKSYRELQNEAWKDEDETTLP